MNAKTSRLAMMVRLSPECALCATTTSDDIFPNGLDSPLSALRSTPKQIAYHRRVEKARDALEGRGADFAK